MLWALGAGLGALIAYFFVAHRSSGSGTIPLPGEAAARPTVAAPREEIHDSERQTLDKVLREHSR